MAEKELTDTAPQQCQSCGILIGPDYLEKIGYYVGEFTICSWCKSNLAKYGHIELDGRRPARGRGTVCQWLYPDGSVKQMRVITVKQPKPDVLFVPLDEPLAEDLVIEEGENNGDDTSQR